MSLLLWQCQNPCRLGLAFIIDWRVVSSNKMSIYPLVWLWSQCYGQTRAHELNNIDIFWYRCLETLSKARKCWPLNFYHSHTGGVLRAIVAPHGIIGTNRFYGIACKWAIIWNQIRSCFQIDRKNQKRPKNESWASTWLLIFCEGSNRTMSWKLSWKFWQNLRKKYFVLNHSEMSGNIWQIPMYWISGHHTLGSPRLRSAMAPDVLLALWWDVEASLLLWSFLMRLDLDPDNWLTVGPI